MYNKIKEIVKGIEDSYDYRTGAKSARECFNELMEQAFWAMRGELRNDRYENCVSEAEQHWSATKAGIRHDFHVTQAYLKSLTRLERRVSLDDYVNIVRWLESMVDEDKRADVRKLIEEMLGI